MRRALLCVLTCVGLLVVGACSDAPETSTLGAGDSGGDLGQRYEVSATILENQQHGPQLCITVLQSLPPQCGGPAVANFSWDQVTPERMNGVTWVEAHLVGTFADQVLTLTEPPGPPQPTPPHQINSSAPCPTPVGGWAVSDPSKVSQQDYMLLTQSVQAEQDYAGRWVDQSLNPHPDNDPTKLVFVVAFTGDVQRHETQLRSLWGGPLCVIQRSRREADLERISRSLDTPQARAAGIDLLGAGVNQVLNTVTAHVLIADVVAQTYVDATYGPGTVVLDGALKPIG